MTAPAIAKREAEQAMTSREQTPVVCHRAYRLRERVIERRRDAERPTAPADEGCFVWIDIQGSHVQALHRVLSDRGVDVIVSHRIDDPAILPRVYEHARCTVCSVHEIRDPDRHLNVAGELQPMAASQLILVLGQSFVVTFHVEPMPCLDYVEARSEALFEFEGAGPSLIAYLVFQRCLYEYAHLNLANDNYLDLLQAGLRSEDFEKLADIIELAHANILTLKKMVSSLIIVLGRLTTMQTPYVDEEFRRRILQLHQNAFPVRWSLDSSRQFLDGVISGMQTAASNRMSEIATVLTIVSTIILPLTLITGIYGMNFDDIPEIHFKGGYFVCLAIMSAIVACQVFVFHRLGWLRSVTRALRGLASPPSAAGNKRAEPGAMRAEAGQAPMRTRLG
jgi:magnesium transporter